MPAAALSRGVTSEERTAAERPPFLRQALLARRPLPMSVQAVTVAPPCWAKDHAAAPIELARCFRYETATSPDPMFSGASQKGRRRVSISVTVSKAWLAS